MFKNTFPISADNNIELDLFEITPLLIFLASFLIVKGSGQLVDFLNNIDSNSYSYMGSMINDWINNLSEYVNYIQGLSNNNINVQDLVA